MQENDLKDALGKMTLSPSGWRAVFAEDGKPESRLNNISVTHKIIIHSAAKIFVDYARRWSICRNWEKPCVVVGMDTRPTSKTIACSVIDLLLTVGCRALFIGPAPAPEIMAFTRDYKKADAFIYVTASHNPVGYNGLKFGLKDGGVLQADESAVLIRDFLSFMGDTPRLKSFFMEMRDVAEKEFDRVISGGIHYKKKSLYSYLKFSKEVIAGDGIKSGRLRTLLKSELKKNPAGVVADFNGSSRAFSVDRTLFEIYGLRFKSINELSIAHKIVPEGDALVPCLNFLTGEHTRDNAFVLGYTPDCDGDRGNVVLWDDEARLARALPAQETFALCCISELAHIEWTGANTNRYAAVVVNDPTSFMVDDIARCFGVEVFRAEVGEANVVKLARKLRKRGYLVRILGEGSAGGNIVHPSRVRDPVSTVFSFIKLLRVRRGAAGGFFKIWCRRSSQESLYREDFTFSDIIKSLPRWTTTGVYEEDALMNIKTASHRDLKARYEEVFLRDWQGRKDEFAEKHNIRDFRVYGYNGTEERAIGTRWGSADRGGLKIVFYGADGKGGYKSGDGALAALWMRGSATEPVLRIMADVRGDNRAFEKELIAWQRSMIERADAGGER